MLKAGITGGIGSGKSIVGQMFATLGVPVFHADDAARHVMETDPGVKQQLIGLLGSAIYDETGRLVRANVAAAIYQHEHLLKAVNAIVHPATISFGRDWMAKHAGAPYILKEAAIFFETGSDKDMDVMIGVSAPLELRISRTMVRSGKTRQHVLDIIARQMDEDEKMKRCDFVIHNDETSAVIPQVLSLHSKLKERVRES